MPERDDRRRPPRDGQDKRARFAERLERVLHALGMVFLVLFLLALAAVGLVFGFCTLAGR